MTRRPVSKSRWAGLAAIAFVGALAAMLLVSTGANAATTSVSVDPTNVTRTAGTVHVMGVTVSPAEGGVLVRYQVLSGPNVGDTGAAATNSSGSAVFSYTGDGGLGTDAILIWADLDFDGIRDSSEPQTAAIVEWLSDPVSGITLTPATSSGILGASHTVTATVAPTQSGIIVRFRVLSGPNSGDTGVSSTNLGGLAAFTYVGNGGTGTDTIVAWTDLDNDGVHDGSEPQTAATRLWTSGSFSGVIVAPVSAIVDVGELHSLNATVSPAQPGLVMRFKVTSGPNNGKTGVALTNSSGTATYSYLGNGGQGLDVVLAWVDLDGDFIPDSGEPQGQATVQWGTTPIDPTVSAAPASATNLVGSFHTVTATVSPIEAGSVIRFRVISGPHTGANARVVTNSSGKAAYSYLGSVEGVDTIRVWVDLDDDGVLDGIESRTSVTKVWTTSTLPQSIALTPNSNVSLLGTNHTLTSTVSPATSGSVVRFWVTAGPNTGDTGVSVTDSQGRAKFTYLGNGGAGSDVIVSWADLNNNGTRQSNEPQASAVQTWSTAPVSGIALSPANSAGSVNTQHLLTATISPQSAGVLVRFRVTQGPNLNDSGADLTDSLGRATFAYLGNGGTGTDLILAWADLDDDGVLDAGEHQASVLVEWQPHTGSNDRELAEEICDDLSHSSHPSLSTLCRLLEGGKLSGHSEKVIIGVIIKQAGFDHDHRGRKFDDDHDDDDDDGHDDD